ncbi:MAG: efflux RND transporter periplasmic adaptor subunit [FCB group bacterium]|nr:efflux RND transporter periplasmic adaptor subunit [FCB group bacterium]
MDNNIKRKNGGINYLIRSKFKTIIIIIMIILAFSLGVIISKSNNTQVTSANKDNSSTKGQLDNSAPQDTIWTCAMHPQIRMNKPGKCPICGMELIPLESGTTAESNSRQLRMSETAKKIAQIQTTPVIRAFANSEIRMLGKISYDETKLAYITAWVSGRLDKLYADFTGISVSKGDPLVYLYSPQLLSAQEELIQAQKAKSTLARGSSILRSTADATFVSARMKLILYGLTEKQIDKILATSQTSDHLTIYAPIGGVVIHKNALEGMYVKPGTRIYTIADLSQLWVYFDAYESDLPWLQLGQQVTFTTLSSPGETFQATISFIDPILDPKTRTAKVRAIVDNKEGKLKPDMFVSGYVKSILNKNGEIVSNLNSDKLSQSQAPLLIPATAPLLTGKRAVVYIEIPNEEGPLFEGRVIVLGPRAGNYYIVKSGLYKGENVVTNGAFKIDAELQIQAKPSMMLPEGGGATGSLQQEPTDKTSALIKTTPVNSDKKESLKALNPKARQALTSLYDTYFQVHAALADDNLPKAKQEYDALKKNIGDIDMSLFGDFHQKWMSISDDIKNQATKGANAKDLEAARQVFLKLAKSIITLHDTFNHIGSQNFYLTFCPMVNNKKGTYWLQEVDTVYNPFYGKAMLRCGSIKDTLAPFKNEGE